MQNLVKQFSNFFWNYPMTEERNLTEGEKWLERRGYKIVKTIEECARQGIRWKKGFSREMLKFDINTPKNMFNKDNLIGMKAGIKYYQDDYGTIFCDRLDQSGMVGGGNEEPRNEIENPIRLERIREMATDKDPFIVMDYGCGHGLLVEYLNKNGIAADGFDKFNPEYHRKCVANTYDVITMVEIIEHLHGPFAELDDIYEALKPGGILYVETSFSDWLQFDDAYIEPKCGHSTIWSHAGLTAMMISKGFKEGVHINRNCRIYTKP